MKHSFQLIHPEKKTSSIRLEVSHNGKKYSKGTGIIIQSALWNRKAKSLSAKCKDAVALDALLGMNLRLAERERIAFFQNLVAKV